MGRSPLVRRAATKTHYNLIIPRSKLIFLVFPHVLQIVYDRSIHNGVQLDNGEKKVLGAMLVMKYVFNKTELYKENVQLWSGYWKKEAMFKKILGQLKKKQCAMPKPKTIDFTVVGLNAAGRIQNPPTSNTDAMDLFKGFLLNKQQEIVDLLADGSTCSREGLAMAIGYVEKGASTPIFKKHLSQMKSIKCLDYVGGNGVCLSDLAFPFGRPFTARQTMQAVAEPEHYVVAI